MTDAWALLAGRTTYQRFADFWPKQRPNPFTDALTRAQKYVASSSLREPLHWENSTLLKGDAVQAVTQLKSELRENLVVFGSGVLVRSLLARGLVDEFVLQIHPLVLGTGRRLFAADATMAEFELVDSSITQRGVIAAVYRRAETT